MEDNIKIPNFLINFGLFPSYVYITYKKQGFVKGTVSLYNYVKIKIFEYFYRNNKWIRKRIKNKCIARNEAWAFLILDMFINPNYNKLEDIKKYFPNYDNWIKDNFDRIKEETINEIIKKENITDENEISKLRDSIKIEDYI